MKPLFSIIIPHYDIPDLLMRCLKSIPVSEDIQVIVVDDNSPDADTYLERYPELSRPYLEFIRTTKGGGAGYARNVGLDHAKGKWLLFADADMGSVFLTSDDMGAWSEAARQRFEMALKLFASRFEDEDDLDDLRAVHGKHARIGGKQ